MLGQDIWGLRLFQPVKCDKMLTKRTNAVYTLESTVLLNVDKIKYVGVTITEDMRWNTHVSNICSKANRTLDYLRYRRLSKVQDLHSCLQELISKDWSICSWSIHGSWIWSPHGVVLQEELGSVEKGLNNYETGSMAYFWTFKTQALKKWRIGQ